MNGDVAFSRVREGAGAFLLSALFSFASALPSRADDMHGSPHTQESELIFGVKANVAAIDAPEEIDAQHPSPAFGGGLFGEGTLVPGWLELEVGVAVLALEGEVVLTLEPLVKKPFHLGESVDLYLAIGPAVGLALLEDGRRFMIGAVGVVGGYFWMTPSVGIDLELSLQLASRDGVMEVEGTLGVGLAFRF